MHTQDRKNLKNIIITDICVPFSPTVMPIHEVNIMGDMIEGRHEIIDAAPRKLSLSCPPVVGRKMPQVCKTHLRHMAIQFQKLSTLKIS